MKIEKANKIANKHSTPHRYIHNKTYETLEKEKNKKFSVTKNEKKKEIKTECKLKKYECLKRPEWM